MFTYNALQNIVNISSEMSEETEEQLLELVLTLMSQCVFVGKVRQLQVTRKQFASHGQSFCRYFSECANRNPAAFLRCRQHNQLEKDITHSHKSAKTHAGAVFVPLVLDL